MKYDAFISYRHMPLDMEIAKKLHRGLETFTIPAAVQKKTGKKKIRRVFRDQEELPIGSNLTDKINAALKETDYLIVVCSPETPGSEWVRKEIETFIEVRDRSHILAILIDGEPEDSFPPLILKDENGRPVEPLAADIRGESKSERNRKFKTELLRLAAPVIGCTFDDLRQRHRERLIRKAIAYVTVTALVTGGTGAAFGIYNASIAKQMETLAQEKGSLAGDNAQLALEITHEFRDKQINQSRFYATESLSLLSDGYRKQAALVACMGLPSEGALRPYVSVAEYALSSALHAYDDGIIRDFYRNLEHELPVTKMWTNQSGSRVITLDSGNYTHVWDSATWEECTCIASNMMASNYTDVVMAASADEDSVYILSQSCFSAYDYSGQLKYRINKPNPSNYLEGIIAVDDNAAFLTDGSVLQMVNLSEGTISAQYDNQVPGLFNSRQKYSVDRGLFVIGHNNTDDAPAVLTVLHSREGRSVDIELSDTRILPFCITGNGNIAVLSSSSDALRQNGISQITMDLFTPEGEKLWSRHFSVDVFNASDYVINMKSHTYTTDDGERCGIVCTFEDEVFTFDETDGSEVMHLNLPSNVISLLVVQDSRSGYLAYETGDIQLVNLEDGRLYADADSQHVAGLKDLMSVNNAFVARTAYDKNINVIAKQTAPDLETLPETAEAMSAAGISPKGDYYLMRQTYNDNIFDFYDPDGNQIFETTLPGGYILDTTFCGNQFVAADKSSLHFIDPIAGTTEDYDYADLGIDEITISRVRFTQNGEYGTFWFMDQLYVLDLKNRTCIAQAQTNDTIGAALITEDGSRIYISEKDKNLYIMDLESGKTSGFDDDRLQQASDYYSMDYLAISRDGRYAAMCCTDQKVWILDTETGKLSGGLPMQIASRTYLRFSDDGRYLFLQGNDYVFRVWDVDGEQYINSFGIDATIKFTVADPEDGKLALITGYSLFLLDLQDYGLCAYVPDCIAYLSDTNSFIQYSNKSVFRCHYKNYLSLIEETARQFPGAELTNAEKVEYNIN